jgi:hypothetical protein
MPLAPIIISEQTRLQPQIEQAMAFVVDFFRSHQQFKRLWEPPFQQQQVPVTESGHFPAGPL